VIAAQDIEKLLPDIRLDIIKYGEILLELLFYEIDLMCELFNDSSSSINDDEENELNNYNDNIYNTNTNNYCGNIINNIYVNDIDDDDDDDDSSSVSSEVSNASTRSRKALYSKSATTSKDFLKAAKAGKKKKKSSSNSRPTTSSSLNSIASSNNDDETTASFDNDNGDNNSSNNNNGNADGRSSPVPVNTIQEDGIDTNDIYDRYDQEKDFIWSTKSNGFGIKLPPLPPLKSYNHDENSKLEIKKKKLEKVIPKKKQKPMSFIDRLKKNVLDDIEDREMADRRKAARKFDTPGFDLFTDADASKYDFVIWVEGIKAWIPSVVHWIDSKLRRWKEKHRPLCISYIQRCYWLIGKQPTNTSTSTMQDWDNDFTEINYDNPCYHIIFDKADALSLYDLLLCRSSYSLSVQNNTGDHSLTLNSMVLDKYFGKHPASLVVRYLMLMLDSSMDFNGTVYSNTGGQQSLLASVISKTIENTKWDSLSSNNINNIDVFDTIIATYTSNNTDDPNMSFDFHKLELLETAFKKEYYEYHEFMEQLLKRNLLQVVSSNSTIITNTISTKTSIILDTITVNNNNTRLLLNGTKQIKATDFIYKIVVTADKGKVTHHHKCASWMKPLFHWSKIKKTTNNETNMSAINHTQSITSIATIAKTFTKRHLQRFRQIEKKTNRVAKTFYYNIMIRIMKRRASVEAVTHTLINNINNINNNTDIYRSKRLNVLMLIGI